MKVSTIIAATMTTASAWSTAPKNSTPDIVESRRSFFTKSVAATIFSSVSLSSGIPTNALDMDAFVNEQISADTKNCNPKLDPKCIPELTRDEALCKYGQSGEARGEACKRVKSKGGAMPDVKKEKSLGGAYAM